MKRRINYEKNYYNTNNLKQYFILIISCVCIRTKKEIIQLDNGYYLETIIEETPTTRASNQKTAKKTGNYKNAQGTTMFSVTVTGTFTYTGSSSTCTKSIASAHLKMQIGKFLQKVLPNQEIKLLQKQQQKDM